MTIQRPLHDATQTDTLRDPDAALGAKAVKGFPLPDGACRC